MAKELATFIVNLHPVQRKLEEFGDIKDVKVQLGGAYVTIEAPSNINYGTLQNIAVDYFRKLCEMKPTEIRTLGYSGPI